MLAIATVKTRGVFGTAKVAMSVTRGSALRLTRLHLHNFRCYVDLSVEFAPTTVIIGPNNGGKSTLLDAVQCLLSTEDRYGVPFVRRTVAAMRDLTLFQTYDEGESELLPDDPVTIVGEFGDLSHGESEAWGHVLVNGALRIGVLFQPHGGRPEAFSSRTIGARFGPMFVLPKEHKYRSADWVAAVPDSEGTFTFGDPTAFALEGERWEPMLGLVPGRLPELIMVPGPDMPVPEPDVYLRPFLLAAQESALRDIPDETFDSLMQGVDEITNKIERQLSAALPRYVESVTGAHVWLRDPVIGPEGMAEEAKARVVRALIGSIDLQLTRSATAATQRDEPTGVLGAGARRATALAALEMFMDPDLWPVQRPVIIAIEEPEVGLHPAAQQSVAASLRNLAAYNIQTMIATHSPVFVNAAPRSGIRIARLGIDPAGLPLHEILEPEGLTEVIALLGASPADVLLGRRFVVVEGDSDVVALVAWSRIAGYDFDSLGIRCFAAGSWSMAGTVAKLLEVAYGPVAIHVVLDGGPDTEREAVKLRDRFGDAVPVDVMERPEIEMYFSRRAVEAWLVTQGVDPTALPSLLGPPDDSQITKSLLQRAFHQALGRSYQVTQGARGIAMLMNESEISPVRDILERIAGQPSHGQK